MDKQTIGFIGGGNMSRAIAGGLLQSGLEAARLMISEPDAARREQLSAELPGVTVSGNNADVATAAATLVLAVKPRVLPAVCRELRATVQARRPLVISIAAGVRSLDIDRWLGGATAIVRVMPNQPALLGKGVSGLFANPRCDVADTQRAGSIMAAVGEVVTVADEADIDVVTAVSGSGPAYFFLLIEMLEAAARQLGLDAAVARTLALATARGAAEQAAQAGESMSALIARVRSPGGTTEAALDSLEAQNVRDIFARAVTAARDRAIALADEAHQEAP